MAEKHSLVAHGERGIQVAVKSDNIFIQAKVVQKPRAARGFGERRGNTGMTRQRITAWHTLVFGAKPPEHIAVRVPHVCPKLIWIGACAYAFGAGLPDAIVGVHGVTLSPWPPRSC